MDTSDSINAWVAQQPWLPKNVVASEFYAKSSRNGHLTWLEKSLRHFQVNAEQLSYKVSRIREGWMHIVYMRDICATYRNFLYEILVQYAMLLGTQCSKKHRFQHFTVIFSEGHGLLLLEHLAVPESQLDGLEKDLSRTPKTQLTLTYRTHTHNLQQSSGHNRTVLTLPRMPGSCKNTMAMPVPALAAMPREYERLVSKKATRNCQTSQLVMQCTLHWLWKSLILCGCLLLSFWKQNMPMNWTAALTMRTKKERCGCVMLSSCLVEVEQTSSRCRENVQQTPSRRPSDADRTSSRRRPDV